MFQDQMLAPLARLLTESATTDLVCNGHLYTQVLQDGHWQLKPNPYSSEAELAEAARLLIGEGGRQLDLAHPFGNVTLAGRIRVHALLGSAINPSTHLSIRVHAEQQHSLQQLAQSGMFGIEEFRQLQHILQSRESFLISGSSGSGKTTLLRAMLAMVPGDRVVAIEDVIELQLASPNFVSLQSRNANVEGKGEINLQSLLTESLRMRPDRLVVGEVRGAELITLLQAINTGHACGATIHSNSIVEVSKRMLAIAHTAGLGESALNALVRSSLNWLIHVDCIDSRRRLTIRKLTE